MEYEDHVTIATPEGVDVRLTLAGFGSRFVAQVIDTLIQAAVLIALAIVLFGTASLTPGDGAGYALAAYAIAAFLVFFAYHVLFETLAAGRTPGKRLTGLRVIREGGAPISFQPSAVRNLIRIVDEPLTFYIAAIVSILVTRRNQRLGDLAAATVVVRERTGTDSARGARRAFDGAYAETGSWDVSAISSEELTTVRLFLERRDSIDPAARERLARDLAATLGKKVVGAREDLHPEAFLDRLAFAKASRG